MTIVVNTHSEMEEKELIAFLKQKKYDYAKEEIPLSDEQLSELLERDGAFEAGKAESFSLDEIKAYFNLRDE